MIKGLPTIVDAPNLIGIMTGTGRFGGAGCNFAVCAGVAAPEALGAFMAGAMAQISALR